MSDINNLLENPNIRPLEEKGAFQVLEYTKDLSVTPDTAINAYYASRMNIRKHQVLCNLGISPVTVQAGAMQWMFGDVQMTSGVRGAGDLFGKMVRGRASGESAIKPEYTGTGLVMLEPTFKHILLESVEDWGGSLVVEDGMFLACESSIQQKLVARSNLSSAAAGGEGLFNLALNGRGVVCLESRVPRGELIEFILDDDVLKIDGSFAIAWSGSLNFTVERSGKSLIGSAASGEGLVNVYRGTGRVLMAPV